MPLLARIVIFWPIWCAACWKTGRTAALLIKSSMKQCLLKPWPKIRLTWSNWTLPPSHWAQTSFNQSAPIPKALTSRMSQRLSASHRRDPHLKRRRGQRHRSLTASYPKAKPCLAQTPVMPATPLEQWSMQQKQTLPTPYPRRPLGPQPRKSAAPC